MKLQPVGVSTMTLSEPLSSLFYSTADTTDSFSTTFNVIDPSIGHLEHVVVTMTIMGGVALSFRGDTAVLLTSPSGTVSTILPLRPFDLDTIEGYQSWPFMSVHFWSEDPVGNWSLDVHHFNFGSVSVSDMTMTLYGTADVPAAVGRIPFTCDLACARGCAAAGPEFCDACAILRNAETLECITECPFGFIEQNGYCYDPSLPEPQCNSGTSVWVMYVAVAMCLTRAKCSACKVAPSYTLQCNYHACYSPFQPGYCF